MDGAEGVVITAKGERIVVTDVVHGLEVMRDLKPSQTPAVLERIADGVALAVRRHPRSAAARAPRDPRPFWRQVAR